MNDAERRTRRVALLSVTTVDDGRGGQTQSWTPAATAPQYWASIEAVSAREFLQSGALQNVGSYVIEMDRRCGVTIKHRIYWPLRSKTFEIVAVRDGEQDYGVELECVEVDS